MSPTFRNLVWVGLLYEGNSVTGQSTQITLEHLNKITNVPWKNVVTVLLLTGHT